MTMANRIAIMSKGRVLQVGTPREVYEHPGSRFVADFIGNVNLFEGRLSSAAADRCTIAGALGEMQVGHGSSARPGMAVTLAVRPEKIAIARERPAGVVCNLFAGRVEEIAYLGALSSYIVQAGAGLRVKVTEANTSRLEHSDIRWDDPVWFWWHDSAGVVLRD